jgi:glycosyltransferase 2 family protein
MPWEAIKRSWHIRAKPRNPPLSAQDLTTRSQHCRWLVLCFSLALSVLTLYFVFRGVNRHILAQLFAMQDRRLLAAAAFFVLLQIGFGGERWRAILSAFARGQSPSLLGVQAVFYASIFFNSLPLGIIGGDFVRVWLARRFALSVKQLVLSVLVDHILALTAVIVLALVTLPAIAHPLAVTAWLVGAAVLTTAAAGIVLIAKIERLLGRWRGHHLIHFILNIAKELQILTPHTGLYGLVCGLLSGACSALAAYCIARSLGMDVGPIEMIAIISMVTVVIALPISMAGWGVREVSLVALLGLFGATRESALLLSVEFGLIAMLLSLPGGIIWLTLGENRDGVALQGDNWKT